jgi:hypothetical protein
MILKKLTFLLFSILLMTAATSFAQSVRGFYVSGIDGWLGNNTKENDILNYAKGNGYNYLALYSLSSLKWNGNGHLNKLANFIKKAKTQYNIAQVGAVVETFDFMNDNILAYNNSRSNANEKFDVINQEFEFWITASIVNQYAQRYLIPNGYSVDSAGAFAFSFKELKKIDSACVANNLISEVYVGWPTKGQLQKIASKADRILVHAYRPDDVDVYAYSKQRLKDIASAAGHKKVIAIFSAEPVYMGPWLNNNPLIKAYQSYADDFATEVDTFKQDIELLGYQWFTYGYMPKTVMPNAFITANGPLHFCPGGTVQLTANSGSAYKWIPGGQTTRTITVSNPDIYSVIVTNTTGDRDTSASVSVEYSTGSETPVITTSGPSNFCVGDHITLTASHSSGYLWSNGAMTRSITVSTTGNYTVTTGGTCPSTSLPFHVEAINPPVATVTSSGPLDICQGATVMLTSSPANGYIWSNGATTRSITVAANGNYHVSTYASSNCSTQSADQNVHVIAKPSKPVITTAGSPMISLSNPSVTLKSSQSSSYAWSEGSTTRTISVTQQGNYTVEVTGSNGCSNQSNPFTVNVDSSQPADVNSTRFDSSSAQPDTTAKQTFRDSMYPSGKTIILESISAYPNPAVNAFTLDFVCHESAHVRFSLYDLTGREVQKSEFSSVEGNNNLESDVSQLPRGTYLATIQVGDGERKVVKMVLND